MHQLLHLMAKRLSKLRAQSENPSQPGPAVAMDILGDNVIENLDPLAGSGSSEKVNEGKFQLYEYLWAVFLCYKEISSIR